MNLIKDKISLFVPIQSNIVWGKFGDKYFNPEYRNFIAASFKQSYLASDVNKLMECLTPILN